MEIEMDSVFLESSNAMTVENHVYQLQNKKLDTKGEKVVKAALVYLKYVKSYRVKLMLDSCGSMWSGICPADSKTCGLLSVCVALKFLNDKSTSTGTVARWYAVWK